MAKGKGQRRVFTAPLIVSTTIGSNDYDIEPQPMSRYQEFQDVLVGLFDKSKMDDATGLVEWALQIPFRFLQLFIPDITPEDAASCNLLQIRWLWENIREVNGIDWLESTLKNGLGALSKVREESPADSDAAKATEDGDPTKT
jgi:hypothetical protein